MEIIEKIFFRKLIYVYLIICLWNELLSLELEIFSIMLLPLKWISKTKSLTAYVPDAILCLKVNPKCHVSIYEFIRQNSNISNRGLLSLLNVS